MKKNQASHFITELQSKKGLLILISLSAICIRLASWIYTGRIWEDALITITYARNAAAGYGLIHHLGERPVQGFTSVIGVLIPFLGEIIQKGQGITAIRVSSIIAAIITVLFAYKIAQKIKLSSISFMFMAIYLAFEENQIFYGMSGMETQIAVAILMTSIYFVIENNLLLCGVMFGLALLTRPDLILWVIPASFYMLIKNRRKGLYIILIVFCIVLPWIIYATLLYGSPIPHTILAKATVYIPLPALNFNTVQIWAGWLTVKIGNNLKYFWKYFAPFISNDFIIRTPFPIQILFALSISMISFCLLGIWSSRKKSLLYPPIIFIILFSIFRITFLPRQYFVWYLAPYFSVIVLFIALGIDYVREFSRTFAVISVVILSIFIILPIPFMFPLERKIQNDVEYGVRKKVGEYLKAHVTPKEAVISESLGYIGYYSGINVTIYDYPGLASPKSLFILTHIPPSEITYLYPLIINIKPEWLALRLGEYKELVHGYPQTAKMYKINMTFTTNKRPSFQKWGVELYNVDTDFYVLRRIY